MKKSTAEKISDNILKEIKRVNKKMAEGVPREKAEHEAMVEVAGNKNKVELACMECSKTFLSRSKKLFNVTCPACNSTDVEPL